MTTAQTTPVWPKRADGSNMTIAEMSPDDRHAQMSAANARVMNPIREPRIGERQIGSTAEYDDLPAGYVIEEYDGDHWSIPDWVERSQPHLEGVFSSRAAAEAALRS